MSETIFAVLTISDSCFNKSAEDLSGPCLKQLVEETFKSSDIHSEIIPDDKIIIEQALCKYSDVYRAQAIFTTGGTGFSPRDFTPEATKSVVQKECPQLALAMALESFKKTPFAALSRATCGIRDRTLIVNFPGSIKAVRECFDAIKMILPHAIQLIWDDLKLVRKIHNEIQSSEQKPNNVDELALSRPHVCPHKIGDPNDEYDRNSPYPMLPVKVAMEIIFSTVQPNIELLNLLNEFESPIDIPPFRASIKDGYALKSGFSGVKKVVGYISAGDEINTYDLKDDECFKINTGAPLPVTADCVVQVEDTKLLKTKTNGREDLVEILIEPKPLLDVRPVGCDLKKGDKLFPTFDSSGVVIESLIASVGTKLELKKPKICVISTGSELLQPLEESKPGKIYDSNTTMLKKLLEYFGFESVQTIVVSDEYQEVKDSISKMMKEVDFIICTGGVSMGDKDYIKPVLKDLGYRIHFGRVNMKPGKPMTFASLPNKNYFFGLPGNPVSAFVTFHLFVLPAIRWSSGWDCTKCELATISVKLENEKILLDPRPEYVRASIKNKNGQLYASVTGNQMSSRLQSIVGADVLLHLPGKNKNREFVTKDEIFNASVLRYDFISNYE